MTEIIVQLGISKYMIVGIIGLVFFFMSIRYVNRLFDWFERQTFSTRNYILEKMELLFWDIPEQKVSYFLIAVSLGLGFFTLGLFLLIGRWGIGLILSTVVVIIGWKLPRYLIDYFIYRRIQQYQNQMVDGLTLLANGLRAGLSVPQSIGMVVEELPNPIAQEFSLILQQNRIGVPLEECMEGLVKRIPTEDNSMFVSSVNILRETGGNLAETFDTIVEVIRERIRLKQKIDTYVAQGMFQGIVIAIIPYAIGLMYYIQDPNTMKVMFTHPLGITATFAAIFLDAVGMMIILKIVRIKV